MELKILMFSKKDNVFCDFAEAILYSYFGKDRIVSVRGGLFKEEEYRLYKPEYIISFLSPWIIPKSLMNAAHIASINFHPGPPEYPGTGCYNFALYEQASRYGVTCHHMREKVDSGKIIMTSHFDLAPNETVETLKLKSMNHLLMCFNKVADMIFYNKPLPETDEKWTRAAFTRNELEQLCYIDPTCTDQEDIRLRIKAVEYPGSPGAYTLIGGRKFSLESERISPMV